MSGDGNRGNKGVVVLWHKQWMMIFDISITDVTATGYQVRSMDHALQTEDNTKKRNHLQYYLDTQHNFTPLVFSVEEYMGRETQAEIKRLASLLSNEWERQYSDMCGYMMARLLLSLSRSFPHLLRGSQERKGDNREPVGTPAAYGAEMRRTDLGLKDQTLGLGSRKGLVVRV